MENKEWFGIVRWSADDVASALESNGYPVSEDNIDEVVCQLEHHSFVDYMIAAGWDFIDGVISDLSNEGKLEEYKCEEFGHE